MKRVPIFKLSTSTLFQQDHKLEVLTHGLTSTPTIVSSNNNLTSPNGSDNITTTTTTTTTDTLQLPPISSLSISPPTTPNKVNNNNNSLTEIPLSSSPGGSLTFDHFCNTCLLRFTDKELRNVHYRSGLHRYNLNLRLSHLQPVTEEDYNVLIENVKRSSEDSSSSDDNSSGSEKENNNNNDSDSDSNYVSTDESSSSSDEEYLLRKSKLSENQDVYDEEYYYKTQGYQFLDSSVEMNDPKLKIIQKDLKLQLSVWKCLLGPTTMFKQLSLLPEGSDQQKQLLSTIIGNFKQYVLSKDLKWVVLLCSGGRFAGAVYSGGKCIDHKTFHRYTMRKKQGGSQSKKDSEGGNKKSAGAGIRRYNEKRLKEEVAQLLSTWKDENHFKQCSHIFVFAPKGNTRDILFPPGSFLSPDDERIRVIPFPIIRPTFSEAQRVSTWISSVDIELFDEEKLELERKEQERKLKERQDKFDHEQRLKEKEKRRKEFELQQQQSVEDDKEDEDDQDEKPNQLFLAIKEKDFEKVKYLLEKDDNFEIPLPFEEESTTTTSSNKRKQNLNSPIFIAVENGDVKMTSYLLKQLSNDDINQLNPRWDFITPLHKAAIDGNCDMIELLLNNGADPTLSGGLRSDVPYDCSSNQKTRDTFREWAGDHLTTSKWDFSKAHIVPLTKQMKQEKEEKIKQKRKQQREKDKIKKQNEKELQQQQKLDESQKQQKLDDLNLVNQLERSKLSKESQLSQREKQALAAERRYGGVTSIICDNCKNSIPGTPFERLVFKYCSTQCVLLHKKTLTK
ncbi:hypothetical protein DDB_G0270552 [Dictyostelium discoideum AX4]|uniref:VLRF1 domain-containing protein n=1 Tax=Dictyostelium discoideum TaxID=44689 RepID=Q55DT6_DICDI|nr:hypothetical protein DDB_G0270552 [Dictyostelium discoideum AX4]EAL72626.1 hypothetical protein DDB_G0270552 [Dictyostelium discoideum AX4]|eukprot:XP_646045.1 hypothetical protein DDB_G0270552 [Dictyostelium discoideum AX4]